MQESVDERPLEERQKMGEVEAEVEGGCCGMRCEKELLGPWVGGLVCGESNPNVRNGCGI